MKLEWQYSRNQRRHWVADGEFYGKQFHQLFEIKDNAPYGFIHKREHGYSLFWKGKFHARHKVVKALKESAQGLYDREIGKGKG